jgi:1-acyl-sn-glycerol-3-phosphate acyltransferase
MAARTSLRDPKPAVLPEFDTGAAGRELEVLRDLLPGIEPERRLDDWGRSQRLEDLLDRTVLEFLYRYWFRVTVEGIEHVPVDGGALLVSNHAGFLPPDGAMIAKAIREEHARPRAVHTAVDDAFKGYPGLSMLLPKLGCVAAHPANVHRLLHDERALVLVFPEGREGAAKLYKDRYRLRGFGRGGFVEAAMRARAPIVPVAVVGAEEAAPSFFRLGPFGTLGYLPAKFTIRFLAPIATDGAGERPWRDRARVLAVADEVRGTIHDHLIDMIRHRRSVWLG